MTYEAFKKELYRNLQQVRPARGREIVLWEKGSSFESEEQQMILRMLSQSDYSREEAIVKEDILCVIWRRGRAVSLLHWRVRPIYDTFKSEGWQGVLPQMKAKIQMANQVSPKLSVQNYQSDSGKLILRPQHYQCCRLEMEKGIYWIYGEIALVLSLMIQDEEGELMTAGLPRSMTERWNVSDETILTNALLNTMAKMPPRLYYGTDMRRNYEWDYGVFMYEERGEPIRIHHENQWEAQQGYILTTARRMNGAVALFYPGVKERLGELLGGDYYVGFTGIHEAVLHPVRYRKLHELKETILRINVCFDQREMLTNRVYRYSCSRRELIEV